MSKSLLNAALCGALFAAGLSVQAAPREVTYLLPAPPNSPAKACTAKNKSSPPCAN